MTFQRMRQWFPLASDLFALRIFLCLVITDGLIQKRADSFETNRSSPSISDLKPGSRIIAVPAGGFEGDDRIILEETGANRSLVHERSTERAHSNHGGWPIFLPALLSRDLKTVVQKPSKPFANHLIDPRTAYNYHRSQADVRDTTAAAPSKSVTLTLGEKDLASPGLRNVVLFGFVAILLMGARDWMRFSSLSANTEETSTSTLLMDASKQIPDSKQSVHGGDMVEWSTFSLVCLTSYRFYTGFLSATWLPYLLAMEGADLYSSNQSLFMGVAKLVYGVTILANPLFGLIGDRAVTLSHGVGRRLFLRAGIVVAGCGIMVCVLADMHRYFFCFIFGILLWRIGDALTDVTTEALVPELLPHSQFGAASIAKATQFLLGSIFGFVALMWMNDYHYTWLYWAYLVGMVTMAIPCQVMLWDDSPTNGSSAHKSGPFLKTLEQAYFSPAELPGWFPRACLAVTMFSFGTSPMFFLLLMLRDLVGSVEPTQLNVEFSTCSIVFFVAAAVAVIINGVLDHKKSSPQAPRTGTKNEELDKEVLASRLTSVVYVTIGYAIVCMLLPTVVLFDDEAIRYSVFAFLAMLLGCCFGSGFARFQDINWQLIPNGADVANCMGFNIMCRLFGVGLGNFAAGVMLDLFEYPESQRSWQRWYLEGSHSSNVLVQVYQPQGYVVMCCGSAFVCLICGYLCHTIVTGLRKEIESESSPVPAA